MSIHKCHCPVIQVDRSQYVHMQAQGIPKTLNAQKWKLAPTAIFGKNEKQFYHLSQIGGRWHIKTKYQKQEGDFSWRMPCNLFEIGNVIQKSVQDTEEIVDTTQTILFSKLMPRW
jgi:hypothetical protein